MTKANQKKWCHMSGYTFASSREYPFARRGDRIACPDCGKEVTVVKHPSSWSFAMIPRHKEA